MTHLVASDTSVTGPAQFKGILTIPKPMKPFFGEESLTPALKKLRDNWYEDVVVLAFPTPETDEQNIRILMKKRFITEHHTHLSQEFFHISPVPAFFNEKTGFINRSESDYQPYRQTQKLTVVLNWKIPAGKWTIMRFGKRNNGAVTRPAPAPGLGFEADKFDTTSFNAHYNAYIGKLIKKVHPEISKTGGGWTMIHIDSWEMGSQNWSPGFREQFIKRRGYDPLLYLPVYTGMIVNSREMSERFLWDLRQTSNELIVENHAGQFKRLGQKKRFPVFP